GTTATQYIEILNVSLSPISLNGCTIDDEDADGPNTLPNVVVPAFGIAVITGSTSADFEGAFGPATGFTLISLADLGQNMFNMSNSPSATSEIITLYNGNAAIIDQVNYDDADGWPPDGAPGGSIYLPFEPADINTTMNDVGSNWSVSQAGLDSAFASTPFGVWNAVEFGSPGRIGLGVSTGIGDPVSPVVAAGFEVAPNYPNPFNPETRLVYQILPGSGTTPMEIEVYSVLGERVRTFFNNSVTFGPHEVVWDGRSSQGGVVSSGIYLAVFRRGNIQKTVKMTLIR
ncbi:MAG TPA: T9SS type A sorting domain-containing protein, partial [Calditrichia bacterium]|nr:T9SS type A sorting domain-containing protein [Calditrichia bacterium]